MTYIKKLAQILIICSLSIPSNAAPKSIELPNGLHLKYIYTIHSAYDDYELANEKLLPFQPPLSVRYADWYGNYIYGYASYLEGSPIRITDGFYFIYEKGDNEIKTFESGFRHEDYLLLLGIPKWDFSTAMFDSEKFYRKYQSLEK